MTGRRVSHTRSQQPEQESAMVDYIGVADIQRLVNEIGTATFIERLAAEIEADYKR